MIEDFQQALGEQRERVAGGQALSKAELDGLGAVPCRHYNVREPRAGVVIHAYCDCGQHEPPRLPPLRKAGGLPSGEGEPRGEDGRIAEADLADDSGLIVDPLATYEGMRKGDDHDCWRCEFPAQEEGESLEESAERIQAVRRRKRLALVDLDGTKSGPLAARINFYLVRILPAFSSHSATVSRQSRLTESQRHKLAQHFLERILWHELFHYFCDVQTPLVGGQAGGKYWRNTGFRSAPGEEPLAEAFSYWRTCKDRSRRGRRLKYMEAFEEAMQDSMASLPYYRNWVLFKERGDLAAGLCDYLPERERRQQLCSRGVDAADLLLRSIEPVIATPNAALILWWPKP